MFANSFSAKSLRGGVLLAVIVWVSSVHGGPPREHIFQTDAPPYRVASKISIQSPASLIDLVVSIPPKRLTDDNLLALVKLLKRRYCSYEKIQIAIFTNYRAASVFNPNLEDPWFAEYWRAQYFLDRKKGEESLSRFRMKDRPVDLVEIDLRSIGDPCVKNRNP